MSKKDFCDFIKYINLNTIQLDQPTTISIKKLIEIWKSDIEINGLIYLNNIIDYDIITDFVIEKKDKELLTLWFLHICKLTLCKIDNNTNNEQNIKLTMAHYEIKMRISEKHDNKLSKDEKEMLSFYRKVAVTAILTGHKTYVEKPLIDKLLLNCRVSPYNGIKCTNIEIRPSNIHGNGVFATENIKSGTIVTFYPVDGYNENNNMDYNVAENWVHNNNNIMEDHSCAINDNLKIVADPSNISNKMLLGHMINDSVGNTFGPNNKTHDIQNGIYEYYMKSDNNCKLKINEKYGIIYVITTKEILKDDELTFSYGPLYWFSRVDSNVQHFIDVCNEGKIADFIQTYTLNSIQ